MKILGLSTALFLGLATPTFADQGEGPPADDKPAKDEITYKDALQKCAEFENDPQLVAIEFKVSCFEESFEWRKTGDSTVTHEQTGSRGHSIIMKEKWHTPDFYVPVVKDSVESQCPILTQFVTSSQTSIVVSCEELVNKYQDPAALADRCGEALAEAAPQTQPTGKEVDLCKQIKTE